MSKLNPEDHTGEKNSSMGVKTADGILYAYAPIDAVEEVNYDVSDSLYRIKAVHPEADEIHTFYVPHERLDSLMRRWNETVETLRDITPVSKSQAERELAAFRGEE